MAGSAWATAGRRELGRGWIEYETHIERWCVCSAGQLVLIIVGVHASRNLRFMPYIADLLRI
jgi:hypothetical protein